jgi:hypothetical protein
MRFARERGDAQSRAKAVIGTRPNHPSASRRDRVSAYRACRARSVSPGQRPGSGPPETPRPCRRRSPRSRETVAHMLRNTNRAGGVDGARIGERPLQGRTVDGAGTQAFALGREKRPYRPRADGDRSTRANGATGRQLVIPPPPAPPPRRRWGCLAMRFARERRDAQSRAKAVIGTRPNHPSASRRDRVSAYRACRARSVSPGQRPGSSPPETTRPCRGRSPRSGEVRPARFANWS